MSIPSPDNNFVYLCNNVYEFFGTQSLHAQSMISGPASARTYSRFSPWLKAHVGSPRDTTWKKTIFTET